MKHELGDDISTKLLHHVFRLQFSVSLLRALASDASVRSLRVAVARSEVGDGASRLQTVWRRRRACAMRHFLWSKLCEYALLSDYLEAMKPACADYDYDYATNVNSFDCTIVST